MRDVYKNIFIFFSGLTACFAVLFLNAPMHQQSRKVLAALSVAIDKNNFKIIKIQNRQDLSIEIYKIDSMGGIKLVQSFDLPETHNSYYTVGDVPSPLFAHSLDHDDTPEILIPILDKDLNHHLELVRYDVETQSFSHHLL